jgi:hypothetical protein
VIVYPDALAADTDELNAGLFGLQSLGYLVAALFGNPTTIVDGLACSLGGGLEVSVAAGSIYAQDETDATAYGSLGTNSSLIMKQGLSLAPTTLSVAAPTTSGDSIIYLIEAQYQDVDGAPETLSYYNSSNPTVPYSGPGNDGLPQSTIRRGVCALQVKAGTQAPSPTAPSADSGWTPLWLVEVAYGAVSIVSGDITQAAGAPFIATKLPQAIGAPVANADLADMAAHTVKANNTGSSAAPQDVTFLALAEALGFATATLSSPGSITLPVIVGGALTPLTIQWFQTPTMTYGSTYTWTLPTAFAKACVLAMCSTLNAGADSGANAAGGIQMVSWSTTAVEVFCHNFGTGSTADIAGLILAIGY